MEPKNKNGQEKHRGDVADSEVEDPGNGKQAAPFQFFPAPFGPQDPSVKKGLDGGEDKDTEAADPEVHRVQGGEILREPDDQGGSHQGDEPEEADGTATVEAQALLKKGDGGLKHGKGAGDGGDEEEKEPEKPEKLPEGHPVKMGISISDLATGVWAANGVQAALLMRARTGRGQQVDISLMDCSVALLSNQATYFLTTGHNPPRMGNAHAQVAPYGVFAVENGHVILAPANDGLFHKLMEVLGRSALATDPRFLANSDRTANAKALDAEIAAATIGWTKQGLLDACHAAGVPAGPINRLDEVFADPQVLARGLRVELGGMPGVRSPFVFSDAELALDRPSPIHGDDG